MSFSCLRVVRVVAIILPTLCVLAGNPARAAERIEAVSRALPGLVSETGGAQSSFPVNGLRRTVSADGRYVVFTSSSTNLVPGQVDDNSDTDVFLYDRVSGTMRLASRSLAGAATTGNGFSIQPSISADGRYVAFHSRTTNLAAAGDSNAAEDVFVFDRDTGAVTLVSHATGSTSAANNASFNAIISADGNWVAFVSRAGNVVPGQTDFFGFENIFLWERATNTNTLVSHAATSTSTVSDNGSASPAVSADGSWVAYSSFASNLVDGVTDFNSKWDIYLWERATNTNRLVSRSGASATTAGNGTAQNFRMSADGATVLFVSDGNDYIVGQVDPNTGNDAYLWSRATGDIALVSRSATSATTSGNGSVVDIAALSADGNWAAFASAATNHVTGQTDVNSTEDIFLWSRASGTVELVSRREGTTTTASASTGNAVYYVDVGADGALVAYVTRATQLVTGQVDTNALADCFVFQRATGLNRLVSGSGGSATATSEGLSRTPVISGDGQWVAFVTTSPDVVPGLIDSNTAEDVLLHQWSTNATTLVSRRDAASPSDTTGGPSIVPFTTGVGFVPAATLSADGSFVTFQSASDRLVSGQVDRNAGGTDVFWHDRRTARTLLVSHAQGTMATTGNASSQSAVISADGRFVAFVSRAGNLVAGQVDTTTTDDVFLWDVLTGAVTLVSHTATSQVIAAGGSSPVISANGSWVAFISNGNNLVSGQSDSFTANPDIFLWERATGAITLVSHRSTGLAVAVGNCSEPWMSSDGRFVSFLSTSSIVIAGQSDSNGANDLFQWDRTTGAVTLASRSATSATTAVGASAPAMSLDGNWIAWSTTSNTVVTGVTDTNSANDVFLWERATGTNRLVSRTATSATTAGNLLSQGAHLNGDGSRLAFLSRATNLVTGTDTNSGNDVFVYTRSTGLVALASHVPASATTAGNAAATRVAMNEHGTKVTFLSAATNLVTGQTDVASTSDLFLYDVATGAVSLLSRRLTSASAAGTIAEGGYPSSDGNVVVFTSPDGKIVPNDHNGRFDVFLWINESGSDLAITKTDGISSVVPGQTLTYTITATNAGPLPVTGATVTDMFPAAFQGATWTCAAAGGASCPASGGSPLSAVVNLPVGGTVTFTVTGTVAPGATGTLANTASITTPNGIPDVAPANNSATDSDTLAPPQADLMIAVSDTPDPVGRGATLTYTITMANDGPSTATSVTVTDTLPAGTGFLSASGSGWSCGNSGGVVTCTRPSQAPSPAVPLITIQVSAPVAGGIPTLTNTVAISSATTDPVAGNNTAATETSVTQPSILVGPEAARTTTEAGGTATFLVGLGSAPLADVTVSLTSSDTAEGTVSPASVTFTTSDWSTPRTVTVTGVDDDYDDGDIAYTITTGAASSSDAGYNGIDPADVPVTSQDDDTAGIEVSPTSGLVTTEGGGTATFTVTLAARPRADVTIGLTSSDTGEGTVGPASLTFTTDSWSAPRTVTVTGVDDDYVDGDVGYTIVTGAAVSTDAAWAGLDPADVNVTNQEDDDTAGFVVSPTSGLVTTEAGGTATFTVVLTARPQADVTVGLTSGDTGEGTVDPASLTFTTDSWSTPQTVTVTGVDDDFVDGDAAYTISTSAAESTDAAWTGLDPADVDVTNEDDDAAGIEVSPTSGLVTSEGGGTATFTVVLAARPSADVTIALESSDPGEGQPSPATLTFTPDDWDPQTVTVTGQDDDLRDGDIAYTIVLHPAQSGDPAFAGIDPADVAAVNRDDSYEGVYHTITPCRLVDTRKPGYGPPLQNNQVAIAMVHGACGVPPTARAVAMNLTFSGAGQRGTVLVYPGDLPRPPLPEYLWISAGNFLRSLSTLMPLGADGSLAIMPKLQAPHLNPTVHIVLDVNGYFE